MKRIPELDGVRGVAILAVLVYHLTPAKLHNGWLGVDAFFALSGFLITSLLLREHQKTGTINFKSFYLRRALRLLPALTAMLILYVGIASALGHSLPEIVRVVAVVQFYAANYARPLGIDTGIIGHTWSLAVEEHFYLIWPLAFTFLLRRASLKSIAAWIAFAVAAIAIWRAAHYGYTGDFSRGYLSTDTRADSLLVGCLAAVANQLRWRVPGLAAVLAVAACVAFFWLPGFWATNHYSYGLYTVFAAAVAVAVLWIAQNQSSIFAAPLRFRPLRWTGEVSYSLYLWHPLVLAVVAALIDNHWTKAATAVTALLCFTIAAASYYCVEQPFLKFKDRNRLNQPKLQGPFLPSPVRAVPQASAASPLPKDWPAVGETAQ